nr:TonB-dependent receptor [uncultured Desulfobacter sp.]
MFSHMTYSINDRFSLSGGVRFDKDDKELSIAAENLNLDKSYSEISPKISAEYKINPNVMAYGTVAKGYKSGGFYSLAAEGYPRDYDKETLWNYEIGVKSSLLNNTLLLNISAYYMDISDMQVLTGVDPFNGYISNAASASSKGFELEAQYKLTPELRLFLSAGYNISKFDDFSDANGDYENNYNPYAPIYNYSVGGQYRSHMGFFARVNFTGYGKMYLDKANEYEKDAYFLLHGKIGYETEHFDIYALYVPSRQEVATTILPVAYCITLISVAYRYLPVCPPRK